MRLENRTDFVLEVKRGIDASRVQGEGAKQDPFQKPAGHAAF
jgi:hypothetical protein